MTICSHGCDSSVCADCRTTSFAVSVDGVTLSSRQPTGCAQGCQSIPGEYSGDGYGTTFGGKPWEEITVEGDTAWFGGRGFLLESQDQARELVELTRALLGDACGMALRARATSLLGKYVQGWQFDLALATAHRQGMSLEQFVIDVVLGESGHTGDESDMSRAVNTSHNAGLTLGCYLASRVLAALDGKEQGE